MRVYSLLGGRMLRSLRRLSIVLLGISCLCLVLLSHSQPIAAQSGVNLATISEILDGNQVFIQNRQAGVNDTARRGQRVRTQDARAALRFNSGAVGRLGKNSVLTVGDRCAQLRRGQILVSGAANSCSSSVVAGVRGTTYLMEVDDQDQTVVKVLEGEVTVMSEQVVIPDATEVGFPDLGNPNSPGKPVDPRMNLKGSSKQFPGGIPLPPSPSPEPTQSQPSGTSAPTVVKSGEKVAYNPSQRTFTDVEKLSQQEFEAILTGALFTGFNIQIPGLQDVQRSFQGLFPGVPFPINVPSLNVPGLGIPGIPGLPF